MGIDFQTTEKKIIYYKTIEHDLAYYNGLRCLPYSLILKNDMFIFFQNVYQFSNLFLSNPH